ncbi:MAG TPA: hypothetical protein DDW55_06865 [Gammaproteobacteria bacterium]|nr:hypothetical protein [Gammaproteobacteria bacterium]
MTNRIYRLLVGVIILTGLYFDLPMVLYALIGVVLFEGITNWRIPVIIGKLSGHNTTSEPDTFHFKQRFNIDAEHVWCLILGTVLIIVYVLFYDKLWFLAWFMGFAILGAGISGVCPLFISLKRAGFR